jgi:hypothetical protein
MHWLNPQKWQRDSGSLWLSLGTSGTFDDTHVFAPCVSYENGRYDMWYCGSLGSVANRVFGMGLATSEDGVRFTKETQSPVLRFADGQRSILTPTLLRNPTGSVCREDGMLRMWFSACNFPADDGLHTLHEATSPNGREWTPPSDAQLEHVYAPTIIKEEGLYRMWYADVRADPWCFRYAESDDGRRWNVTDGAVLALDQGWEHQRLFYPTVVKANDMYLMWYGSYSHSKGEEMKTALARLSRG